MDIQQTKEIIIKWIHSCDTVEQLELLKPVILSQWLPRFEKVAEGEMIFVKEDLVNAINDRKSLIVQHRNSPSNVPTLDAYLN